MKKTMTNKERVKLLKKIKDELRSSKGKDCKWLVTPQTHLQPLQISVFQNGYHSIYDEIAAVDVDLEGNLIKADSTLSQAFIDEATEYAKFWLAIDNEDNPMTNKERVKLLKKINDELMSSEGKDCKWLVAPQTHLQPLQISVFQNEYHCLYEKIAAVDVDLEGNLIKADSTFSQAFIDEATEYAKFWLAIDNNDTPKLRQIICRFLSKNYC